MKYILPCPSGPPVIVETSQAGQTVVCECGDTVVVPTLRELNKLEPYVEASSAASTGRSESDWGSKQGLMFLGTFLILVALGIGAYLQSQRPDPVDLSDRKAEDFTQLTLPGAMNWYQHFETAGIHRAQEVDEQFNNAQNQTINRWMYATGGLGGAGVLMVILGLCLPKRKPLA